jgi:hypothetical protein
VSYSIVFDRLINAHKPSPLMIQKKAEEKYQLVVRTVAKEPNLEQNANAQTGQIMV